MNFSAVSAAASLDGTFQDKQLQLTGSPDSSRVAAPAVVSASHNFCTSHTHGADTLSSAVLDIPPEKKTLPQGQAGPRCCQLQSLLKGALGWALKHRALRVCGDTGLIPGHQPPPK